MNITDTDEQRLQLGIELLLGGQSLVFHGVVIYKRDEKSLCIDSFSDWAPDQTTEGHAKERIARSKEVLTELGVWAAEKQVCVGVSEA
jgi:hypothetical protein